MRKTVISTDIESTIFSVFLLNIIYLAIVENVSLSRRTRSLPSRAAAARRVEILGEILQDGMISQNTKLVGKTIDVIYEDIDYDRNMFVGRTQFDAPQIDSVVYFTGDFADVGEIYKIKITAVDGYDLKGELAQ